jgi:hypothetical protein
VHVLINNTAVWQFGNELQHLIIIENIILSKTIEFSLDIIRYVELLEEKRKFVIANQLLKSGTDFIHKFKVAAKEIEETKYWLVLCSRSESYPDCSHLERSIFEIDKIITKIIATSKSTRSTT